MSAFKLRLIDADESLRRLTDALGAAPGSPEGVAELVRIEALAAGVCRRHLLVERVERRLGGEPRALVERVLGELARFGDVVEGGAGEVAAGPTRAVALLEGGWALLGAAALPTLRGMLGEQAVRAGIPRRVGPEVTPEKVGACLRALRGRELSLARWAGFSRLPAAQGWLRVLDDRLADQGGPEGESAWIDPQWYDPKPSLEGPRRAYSPRPPGDGPGLVRGEVDGFLRYGWVRDGRLLPLSTDEARRTTYALSLAAGEPLRAQAEQGDGGEWVVRFPLPLPMAEYRALRLSARGAPEPPGHFRFEASSWDALRGLLVERLGVM